MKEPDKRQYKRLYRIASFTQPDKEYIVGEKLDGKWTCTCPAYIYRRGRKYTLPSGQGVCKHIYAVAMNPSEYTPYWDKDREEYEELMKYAVNYIKEDLLDARIESMMKAKAVAEIEPEDIPLFEEDYARLNIPIKKGKDVGIEL